MKEEDEAVVTFLFLVIAVIAMVFMVHALITLPGIP
jgi:hypothetical protein